MSYYSQNDEERFVLEYFAGQTGRLLDVGAFDGKTLSNTWRLVELGWSGVMVEPAPHAFLKLLANCAGYSDRLILVLGAVAAVIKKTRLWIDQTPNREWSNTINFDLVKSGSVMRPLDLDVRLLTWTMADLEPFGPFDFISLDAEWEDLEILRAMPETMIRRLKLLCIESRHGDRDPMAAALADRKLKIVYQTPENFLATQL